jgi:hypothetical protein
MDFKKKLADATDKFKKEFVNKEMAYYALGVIVGTTATTMAAKRRYKNVDGFARWVVSSAGQVPEGVRQEIWREGNTYYIKKVADAIE